VTGTVLILGCGYTGARVARLLLARGVAVHVTARDPATLAGIASAGAIPHALDVGDPAHLARLAALVRALPAPLAVLCSVPLVIEGTAEVDPLPRLVTALGDRPSRLVHLSTTSVYGATAVVDERTAPAPRLEREHLRLAGEGAAAAGPWCTLVLRAAAIYGPGRGVHVAVRTGRFRWAGAGLHVLSRIHVDDLAAITAAALDSDAAGAYPVADDEPAVSLEVAAYAARLMGVPLTPPAPAAEPAGPGHVERRVDGRAIRKVLGVTLQYPSYRVGIPAALAAEGADGPRRA
jgi:nucleoside-diphosphate-sugar epimerase